MHLEWGGDVERAARTVNAYGKRKVRFYGIMFLHFGVGVILARRIKPSATEAGKVPE